MEISGAADESNTLITLGRRYIYDGWSVVEERTFDNGATLGNSPNTLERVYVNGRSIDEPLLAAIDGDGDGFLNSSKNTTNGVNLVDAEYYYLSNRLGSISAILDADNQDRILEYYRYEVFGSATVLPIVDVSPVDGIEDTPLDLNDNNTAGTTLVSSFGNTYLYTARRFDDVTGLYYYRNRYYDPRSGRFITRDPSGYWPATKNLYGYVRNITPKGCDPLGFNGPVGPLKLPNPDPAEKLPPSDMTLKLKPWGAETEREITVDYSDCCCLLGDPIMQSKFQKSLKAAYRGVYRAWKAASNIQEAYENGLDPLEKFDENSNERRLLEIFNYEKSDDKEDWVEDLADNLDDMLEHLQNTGWEIECESEDNSKCDTAVAYVTYWGTFIGGGTIHVCCEFIEKRAGDDIMVGVLMHELSHYKGQTGHGNGGPDDADKYNDLSEMSDE